MKYLHKSRAVFFVDSNLFGLDVVVVVVAVLLQGVFFSSYIFFFQLKKNQRNFSIKKKIKWEERAYPKGKATTTDADEQQQPTRKKKFQYNRRQITNSLSTVTSVYFVIKWNVNNSVIDSTTICEGAMNQSAP